MLARLSRVGPWLALSLLFASPAWAQSDLVVSSITAPNGNVPYFSVATVSFTVNDVSGSFSGNVGYDVALQTGFGGPPIAWDSGQVFVSAGAATWTQAMPFPPGLSIGAPYSVRVTIDTTNVVAETNENNNQAVSSPPFSLQGAELAPSMITAPTQIVVGRPAAIAWRTTNSANLAAQDFVTRVVLNDGAGMQWVLHDTAPTTLAGGQFVTTSTTVTIPAGAGLGSGSIGVMVDVFSAVPESSEANNFGTVARTIRAPAPDLTIAVGDVPMAAEQGQSLDLSVSVANDGEVAATTGFMLYLSPDASITPSDRPLGGGVETVAPGEVESSRVVVDLPLDVVPGDYYIGAYVDPTNAIVELDDTNNAYAEGPLAIFASPFSIVTEALPDGVVDVDYAGLLVANGNTGVVVWSVASGALPNGVTLSSGGELAGRPSSPGVFDFVVAAEDDVRRATAALRIVVHDRSAMLTILTMRFPTAIVGEAYEAILVASGGASPYVWRLGMLPPGLRATLDGEVSGTPQLAGVFAVPVEVTDARGSSIQVALELEVEEGALGPRLLPADLPDGDLGVDYCGDAPVFIHAIEGRPPYAFRVVEGGVPGLTLDPSGALCGTPSAAGMHSFVVQVFDAAGGLDTERYALRVGTSLRVTSGVLPTGTVGVPYEARLVGEGGVAPYTWSVTQGTLPSGLALEGDVVRGTPTTPGLASIVIGLEDAAGGQVIGPVTIQVVKNDGLLEASDAVGCGCSAGGRPRSSWVWLGLLVMGGAARRGGARRSRRRERGAAG